MPSPRYSQYGGRGYQSAPSRFSSPVFLAAATAALGALGVTAYLLYASSSGEDKHDTRSPPPAPQPEAKATKTEETTTDSTPVAVAAAPKSVPREASPSVRAASADKPSPAAAAPPPAAAAVSPSSTTKKKKDEEDEDDMFAVADGPRLFSPSAAFPQKSKSASVAAPAARPSGTAAITSSKEEPLTDDIVERTKVLNLVRVLLNRIDGVDFEASDTESDSDETDVSLNFHIATELEAGARDELMVAFDDYEATAQEAAASGDEEPHLEDLATVLVKIAEYLDISNEREKLRIRRDLLHEEQGQEEAQAQSQHRTSLPTTQEVEAELAGRGAGYREALAAQARQLEAEYSAMDRMLHAREDEKFEDDWGDEDQEEADFMAYLQQEDGAVRTYTRHEMKERKEAVHVQAPNGRRYSQPLAPLEGEEGEDEEAYEDIEDEEGEEGEEDDDIPEPWEDEEKLEFEENLYDRIYELAETWGVTRAMGEREGVAMEEARRLRRVGRVPAAEGEEEEEELGEEEMEEDEEWYDDEEELEEVDEEEWYEEEEEEEVVEPPPLRPAAPVPFAASRSLAKGGSPAGVIKSVSPPTAAHGRKGAAAAAPAAGKKTTTPAATTTATTTKAAAGKENVAVHVNAQGKAKEGTTKTAAHPAAAAAGVRGKTTTTTATGSAPTTKFSRK